MAYPEHSLFNEPELGSLIIAALVHKLGGAVTVTQADIDAVAYTSMSEVGDEHSVSFKLGPQGVQQ